MGDAQRPFQERHADVPEVCYLKCDIPDRQDDPNLQQVLEGAAQFLQSCKEQGGIAIVRMHGQSRSAAVICAYLIMYRQMSADAAWTTFAKARIKVDPQLVWWEAMKQLQHGRKRALEDVPRDAERTVVRAALENTMAKTQ